MWIEVFTYLKEARPDGRGKCEDFFVAADMGGLDMNT